MRLKQEFSKLKLQDKQENYNKKLRQTVKISWENSKYIYSLAI